MMGGADSAALLAGLLAAGAAGHAPSDEATDDFAEALRAVAAGRVRSPRAESTVGAPLDHSPDWKLLLVASRTTAARRQICAPGRPTCEGNFEIAPAPPGEATAAGPATRQVSTGYAFTATISPTRASSPPTFQPGDGRASGYAGFAMP